MGKEKKRKKSKSDVSKSNILEENSNGMDGSPIFSFELSCGFTNGSTIKKYPVNKYKSFSSDDEADIIKDKKELKKDCIDTENSTRKNKKMKNKIEQDSLDETVESKEKKKKSKDTKNQIEEIIVISK